MRTAKGNRRDSTWLWECWTAVSFLLWKYVKRVYFVHLFSFQYVVGTIVRLRRVCCFFCFPPLVPTLIQKRYFFLLETATSNTPPNSIASLSTPPPLPLPVVSERGIRQLQNNIVSEQADQPLPPGDSLAATPETVLETFLLQCSMNVVVQIGGS